MTCIRLLAWFFVTSAAEPPASAPVAAEFAPGVRIDWQCPAVYVRTHVVFREGPLEFLACFAGKEHESILRFDASAVHIYQALGLVGMTPGHPPMPNVKGGFDPPAGDLVDINLRWTDEKGEHVASAFKWLCLTEYGTTPIERPWVFGGSIVRPDNTLASDHSGVGIALVDFHDSLLCYSRRFPSRYGSLWVEANTGAIPPLDTPVWLEFRRATARDRAVDVDHLGVIHVDGRYCTIADLIDILKLERQLAPTRVQVVTLDGVLRADERRLRHALNSAGIPEHTICFSRPP